jgi:hypothetical protein
MKGDFKYEYDIIYNEWYVTFDNHRVMTFSGGYVEDTSDFYDVAEGKAVRLMFAEELLTRMENEDNGFFVSAFLSKMFNYGMNWTKEVR